MKPERAVREGYSWRVRRTVVDARVVGALLLYLPVASATAAALLALRSTTTAVVRGLAVVGLALLPAATVAVTVLAVDGDLRRAGFDRPAGLVDASVLLAVSLAALVVAAGPLVDLGPALSVPAAGVLVTAGYLVVPFWLGTHLLPAVDGFEVGLVAVLASTAALLAGVALESILPLAATGGGGAVVVGTVGPVVALWLASRAPTSDG